MTQHPSAQLTGTGCFCTASGRRGPVPERPGKSQPGGMLACLPTGALTKTHRAGMPVAPPRETLSLCQSKQAWGEVRPRKES